MITNRVALPWPLKALSPNSREHWTKVAKAKADYKNACYTLAKQAGIGIPLDHAGKIALVLDFVPPSRRKYDDDNLIASFKAGRDGLAAALGINDERFITTVRVSKKIGGLVHASVFPLTKTDEITEWLDWHVLCTSCGWDGSSFDASREKIDFKTRLSCPVCSSKELVQVG